MRGVFAIFTRWWDTMAGSALIGQWSEPLTASPAGEAQTVEKGVLTPWPPLRGGSARRRWGRELYGCPKYFGLWQGSLPPPLRGTAPPLAQAPPPPYRGSLSRRGRFFGTLGFSLGRSCQRPRPLTDEGKPRLTAHLQFLQKIPIFLLTYG